MTTSKTPSKENKFKLNSAYQPTGDQPSAIKQLMEGLNSGKKEQVLLGVTGSGKTFTMANLIQKTGKPTLIISHNKTLAAQLYAEFRSYFPENAVHYFVSYFDYYQPEAYIASSDTFIEKDSKINEEIDRLRHAATSSLLSRRDVIIIASVSAIYGIGSVEDYGSMALTIKLGEQRKYDKFLRHLTDIQYERNDYAMERGTFRVKGDVIDVVPAGEEVAYRIEFFGDEVESLKVINPLTGEVISSPQQLTIYPSSHYVTPRDKLKGALGYIEQELKLQAGKFKKNQQFIEHQRIKQRVEHDLEMLRETGFVKGIENYLLLIDESHMTLPQIRGMYNGDRARKEVLVEHGFRLPSALDNRPLTFAEFDRHINQAVYISATPAPYELEKDPHPAQQIIRPTGLLDPKIEIRPTANQVDDLIDVIRQTIKKGQRILATTLTKRMAEDLSDHLEDLDIKAAYLHSDVDTVERTDILRDLRLGIYDVLIGINLLREGLDLPEVSLVAILDADKEGFLRSEAALVQTVGRAARHQEGKVIMYADKITNSMERAISETELRRKLQIKFNKENGITPISVQKEISQGLREIINSPDSKRMTKKELQQQEELKALDPLTLVKSSKGKMDPNEKKIMLSDLQSQMELASANLQFELAAQLRDAIKTLQNPTPRHPEPGCWI